ncbi:Sec-independent protein translocase protein TatB [Mycobacterium sp.]|jgi:sec-independent protein translocase protein TatB|uniref:Sec-independent protein translocase protein TatB n=1 Tax=Mycobacterium sp. TaxID=1785 RepID=UPI002D54BE62|nr:Sec-independent protein translocase protein TatB [Mycobacterium sp.]HZA11749.1 Sec-independent protein translocase protein TatB [Mycobacterium sp.]
MFANIGWGEMLVLVVVGLVIFGPERLPGAIRWTANTLRQARDYVGNATSNLREELGPEFDGLREPLSELQRLRGMTPRAALTKHLLDGDDSVFRAFDKPVDAPPGTSPAPPLAPETIASSLPATTLNTPQNPESNSGTTPFDPDAT